MKITKTQLKKIIKEEIGRIQEGPKMSYESMWAQFSTSESITQPWQNEFLHETTWTREKRDFIDAVLKEAYMKIADELKFVEAKEEDY